MKVLPSEKRCWLVYTRFLDKLEIARSAVSSLDGRLELFRRHAVTIGLHDKGLIGNNLTVVFLIGMLESFLRDLSWHI